MKPLFIFVLTSVLVATVGLSGNALAAPDEDKTTVKTVKCEAGTRSESTCIVPWTGPSQLVQQMSGSDCIEGRTWRSGTGEVTVNRKCTGEFAPANDPGEARATAGTR